VTMKCMISWVVVPRSSEKARCFGGTYHLHFRGRRNQQNQPTSISWLLDWLTLRPWRWRRMVPPKHILSSKYTAFNPETDRFLQNTDWLLRTCKDNFRDGISPLSLVAVLSK
jgi:hypothetical protein